MGSEMCIRDRYSNDAEYSGNARRNDGVDGAAHRGRNASEAENGRFSQKDSRDNKTAVKKKFSMEVPVEEKKNLIALHNLDETNIRG